MYLNFSLAVWGRKVDASDPIQNSCAGRSRNGRAASIVARPSRSVRLVHSSR